MASFKKGKESRHVSAPGELRVLRQLTDYEFGVELWVMRDGLNSNNWDYRNIEEYYQTFLGTPILCAYVGGEVGDGHNMRQRRDPKTGELYYTFTDGTAERIVGTLSDDPKDLTLRERDGHTWIVGVGRLFAFYAPELVEKIVRTGRMDISAETEVKEAQKDGDKEIYTVWAGLGVTILGDKVAPAIPGARIAALEAMQDEFKTLKLRAASLAKEPGKKPQQKNPIQKGVSKVMNKQAKERLAPKFEGYSIVGLSEDGLRVALMDKTGNGYTYTFNAEDNGEVVKARIVPVNLSITFPFGEDVCVMADMGDAIEVVCAGHGACDATIKELSEKLDVADKTLKTMREAEHKRRVEAVKNSLKATLAKIKASAAEDDPDMDEDEKAISNNAEEYAGMEKDGEFCGEAKACADLMAKCMEKKLAKAEADKKAKKSVFAWDSARHGGGDDGVEGMLSRING